MAPICHGRSWRFLPAGVLAGVIAALCGCGPAVDNNPAAQTSQTLPSDNINVASDRAQWKVLFDGTNATKWRNLRGRSDSSKGTMVLDARDGPDVIVLATGLSMQDGEIEVELLRKPVQNNDGPFTISLRLPAKLWDWTGVYVVCRPGNVEVCKGSASLQQPPPEMSARHDADTLREIWRFVMHGGLIDCYRCGKKLLTYVDAMPRSGSICLTASKCRVEVLAVRYRSDGENK